MYKLDAKAAANADTMGKWLSETGKYTGKILCCEDIQAASGTRGVVLTLQADDGRETRQYVYTVKSDGTNLSGYDLLMSMMTVLRLRSINPVSGIVKRWDSAARQEYTEEATVFQEFANKRIGFLLQRTEEESRKNRGETAWTAKLIGVFDAETELVAAEILGNKKTPEILPRRVAALADRPMKRNSPARGSNSSSTMQQHGGSDGMDDDIPF